jgi:uncharacterized protein (UPF0276 family)
MIQLGANGSEHLEAFIEAGQVQVDYLKVGAFLGRARIAHLKAHYPLLLHGSELALSARPPLDGTELVAVLDYVALTGTPWYSVHLGFAVDKMAPGDGDAPADGTGPLSVDEARRRIIRNARILENVPRFLNAAHDHVCEPDFIAEVVQAADTGFLLDLAHARVSAACLGYDLHDYLHRLPLDRTVEIHVSGPRLVDGMLQDVHEPLCEADYNLVVWALQHTPARAITLEYWKDKNALREQLVRLRALVDAVND